MYSCVFTVRRRSGDGDNPMYIVGNMVRDYLRDEWHLQAFNPEMGYKFVPTRLDWFLR